MVGLIAIDASYGRNWKKGEQFDISTVESCRLPILARDFCSYDRLCRQLGAAYAGDTGAAYRQNDTAQKVT